MYENLDKIYQSFIPFHDTRCLFAERECSRPLSSGIPLQAEVSMPEDFSGSEPIKIYLEQDGHPVEEADFAHVEIWKGDGKIHDEMKEARNVGQGNYTFSRKLSDDGLYYIKVHAGNNGSIIMPTLPLL